MSPILPALPVTLENGEQQVTALPWDRLLEWVTMIWEKDKAFVASLIDRFYY
jgi:hypothetical protein